MRLHPELRMHLQIECNGKEVRAVIDHSMIRMRVENEGDLEAANKMLGFLRAEAHEAWERKDWQGYLSFIRPERQWRALGDLLGNRVIDRPQLFDLFCFVWRESGEHQSRDIARAFRRLDRFDLSQPIYSAVVVRGGVDPVTRAPWRWTVDREIAERWVDAARTDPFLGTGWLLTTEPRGVPAVMAGPVDLCLDPTTLGEIVPVFLPSPEQEDTLWHDYIVGQG